jgi:hypothetical protein
LGFQRDTRWPKWTPASMSSLMIEVFSAKPAPPSAWIQTSRLVAWLSKRTVRPVGTTIAPY